MQERIHKQAYRRVTNMADRETFFEYVLRWLEEHGVLTDPRRDQDGCLWEKVDSDY
jgi:hypothetical protein